MIRFVIYALLIIAVVQGITPEEASETVQKIIKKSCGDGWFDAIDGHAYCKGIPPNDAAKIIGTLCLQK